MGNLFLEITVIIAIASILSLIFKLLKQPEILAYILTGIIIGPLGFFNLNNGEVLHSMGQFGVTLLLFMIGMEIKLSDLNSIGKSATIIAVAQVIFTFISGYLLSLVLGFNVITALYLGLALTFSSTIILVKILSDKKDLHSLYGKVSIVILLIQDFAAILLLVFISNASKPAFSNPFLEYGLIALKAVALFSLIIFLSQKVFPKLVEPIAKSSQTLFLLSLAWVFGLSALVTSPLIGFSLEIGGFLAGLALANSIANYQIIAKVKILRDFFIVMFFVLLGFQMKISNISSIIFPVIVFSLFVLFIKPFIIMILTGDGGYKKRTSFLTGISLSNISEFSLILVFLGYNLGAIDDNAVSIVTLVGIITFASSSYLINANKTLFKIFSNKLNFFENSKSKNETYGATDKLENLKNHVVLIGGDQMGQSILRTLENSEEDLVVIDFDPKILSRLIEKNVNCLFGDIADLDIQARAKLDTAKLVISTIPDLEDNLTLLKELQHENRKAKIVVMAIDSYDAKLLYKAGADYVVLPYVAGGMQVNKILKEHLGNVEALRKKDEQYLN